MKDLITVPELKLIDESKAENIRKTFEPMYSMLKGFEEEFNEIIQESNVEVTDSLTDLARDLRIRIAKVRINTGKLKDKQKEYIKLEDKAIMGVHNILVFSVKEYEDKLKDIEDHFERVEREKKTALQFERWDKLKKFLPEDSYEKDLSAMDEDVFSAYLKQKIQDFEDIKAAEKQSELDRIAKEKAEAEERKRMQEENATLKAAAEEANKLQEIRIANEAKEREAQEAIQLKERKAHEVELKVERDRIAKLEADQKAKEDAEIKAKEDQEAKKQAELSKGDSDKVKDLVNDLNLLKRKYSFKSAKNQKMYFDVCLLIDKVTNHINK